MYKQSLKPEIFKSLKSGVLNSFLEAVKNDSDLHTELRGAGNYVSVYYRGGAIFQGKCKGSLTIDHKYIPESINLPAKN